MIKAASEFSDAAFLSYVCPRLEVELHHHVHTVISDPVETLVCKTILVKLAFIVLTVLNACPLILETDVHLTYIIYKLWVDSVKLIDLENLVVHL